MVYTIRIRRPAQKEIARLSPTERQRVDAAIRGLAQTPRPHGCKKLEGSSQWRVHVGHVRVRYDIDDAAHVVTIRAVRRRDKAYQL